MQIIDSLRQELLSLADEGTRLSTQHYFKEEVKAYGLKGTRATQVARAWLPRIKGQSKSEVFALCGQLWQSGWIEESFVACEWAYSRHREFKPGDFQVFERWVKEYVSNWASCDTLCNHTVGTFVEMYPGFVERLKEWAREENRWVKRAAAVTLIIPARKGLFFGDILQIAGILLCDADDMVQKGYGWMLKAASEARQKEVFDFVVANKAVMPRTALRYAIEKMPPGMRAEAMKRD